MDLTLSPAEEAFRDELRVWLQANNPGREPAGEEAAFEFRRDWQRQLHQAGWAGVSWPKEYGGRGATLIEQAIFNEEIARAQAPQLANGLGLAMGGPTVIAHGTEEQRQRYLEPILSAEEIWCQGFSEPESGSDLASLKTRAVRDGDEWVVTGQKVWTTFAHHAKWCMLVARTDRDAPKHKGLTYFLMDMEQDGVQVRPLRQITGEAEFNELFIEEARIPDENIIGGVGNGWAVAITTLMHERATLAFSLQVGVQIALRELVERAQGEPRRERPHGQRGPGGPPAPGAAADRGRGAAAERLPRAERDDAHRRAGARGLARQVALVGDQPVADRAGDGHRRPAGDAGRRRAGPTASCARARTRSRAVRPRSSRTSSPSACSDCRGCDELRVHRRPAGDQAHGPRLPRLALQLRGDPRAGRRLARLHRCRSGASWPSWAGRG